MKKIILLSIMILSLISCTAYIGVEEVEIGCIEDYDFENDIPEFETPIQAAYWVKNNIVYVYDYIQFGQDYIQTPEEFYYNRNEDNLMQGDCDDFTTMFCYIIDIQFPDLSNYFISVKYPNEKYNHTLAYINGFYYDIVEGEGYIIPLSTLRNDIEINYTIPYCELIWMVVNYHEIVGY